jgi:hypothetical protein
MFFAAKIAFDHVIAVDRLANLQNFRVRELRDPAVVRDVHLVTDFPGLGRANAMNVLKRDEHALVGRDIDAGYTGH